MASTLIDRLDGLSSSAAIKGPARAATTANISLYGLQTIDGVALADDDRVLVKDQSAAYENGIYVVDTGQWRRVKDFNKTRDVLRGTLVYVSDGTANGSTTWNVASSTNDVGTSNVTFSKLTGNAAGLDVGTTSGTVAAGDDARILQAAALPTYTSSEKGQTVVVKADGSGLELSGGVTGKFFAEDGARIVRMADRVFMGGAVIHNGTDVDNQPDWLTQKLISYGRTFGFGQVSQTYILTYDGVDADDRDLAANGLVVGAKTSLLNLAGSYDGNAIGILGVGVNDSTDASAGAWGVYGEGFKEAGTQGPAYGAEFDSINFYSTVAISPFTQNDNQTIGIQIASGAEFVGANSASAAINIRNNGANFLRGIIIGNDAISGTDGTTGRGPWVQVATGHTEQIYSDSTTMAWESGADPGLNGDYFIESQGTGSLTVKRFKETVGDVWTTFTPTITAVSGTFTSVSATGRYRVRGKSVEVSIDITTTTNGTAAGGVIATLPFTAASGVRYTLVGSETATTGVLCQGRIGVSGTTAQIFKYDNTYPGGTGTVINLTGVYQRS